MRFTKEGRASGVQVGEGQQGGSARRASSSKEGHTPRNARDAGPDASKRLMTVGEASRYLSISRRTLWQLTNVGEVPRITFGTGSRPSVRYDRQDLDRWVEARKRGGAA